MNLNIPVGLSLSKPRIHALPFDRLRANGIELDTANSILKVGAQSRTERWCLAMDIKMPSPRPSVTMAVPP